MDEKIASTIDRLKDWKQVSQFESNARSSGRMTEEMGRALHGRALVLAQEEVKAATGFELTGLSEAEAKILKAITEYVALKRRGGSNANRTLEQVKRRGFIGAAEVSVEKAKPTQGFLELSQAGRGDLSYENIVVQHPGEFSERTLWYARRTLRLGGESEQAPADIAGVTQSRTEAMLLWLQELAEENAGRLPEFTNAELANAIGLDGMGRFGRSQGNIQSRIDFACFKSGLPPLGLAAAAPFDDAWQNDPGDWEFPVAAMQVAARKRIWTADDFQRVLERTRTLQAIIHPLWREAMASSNESVRTWAFGMAWPEVPQDEEQAAHKQPRWAKDELILALDLYLRNRASPPDKRSPEVADLSAFLGRLGRVLGNSQGDTFRNENGVYMKMMNFRRFDTEFIKHGKVGLSKGNKDEESIWNEFSAYPEKLLAVVAAIRATLELAEAGGELDRDEDGIEEAPEGRLLTRLHRTRERSRKLVDQRKKKFLQAHGRLFCEACGFDFAKAYGEGLEQVIDCHHTKPVHTLVEGDTTRLDDLVLLCANCHRAVHSCRPWLSMEQLRQRLQRGS
ncbi:HNH endonuclease [Lysobacter enzymogenes]|uniref:HNH endonuclease n=1 Tax=Lysobacter enzymogenes TaxID=69 RepID=UPI0008965C05|nr:HNH endonuclease [Lysobacter enzymogenes]SDX46911.1 Predicted restriction endonuclease, HNH family [Lysobacter enzymogenes]